MKEFNTVIVKKVEGRNSNCSRLHFEDGTDCFVFGDGQWKSGIKQLIRTAYLQTGSTITFNRLPENGKRFQFDICAVKQRSFEPIA